MKRSEKAAKILEMLEEFYPETPVPLDHENSFQLLIAVLMSAQTTDKKVNQVTPELFRHGPDAKSMAELEVSHIQEMIREVGLAPTKAKNISKLAKILVESYEGEIPDTFEGLESLPGGWSQNCWSCYGSSIWSPCIPNRYAYSQTCSKMGAI